MWVVGGCRDGHALGDVWTLSTSDWTWQEQHTTGAAPYILVNVYRCQRVPLSTCPLKITLCVARLCCALCFVLRRCRVAPVFVLPVLSHAVIHQYRRRANPPLLPRSRRPWGTPLPPWRSGELCSSAQRPAAPAPAHRPMDTPRRGFKPWTTLCTLVVNGYHAGLAVSAAAGWVSWGWGAHTAVGPWR